MPLRKEIKKHIEKAKNYIQSVKHLTTIQVANDSVVKVLLDKAEHHVNYADFLRKYKPPSLRG